MTDGVYNHNLFLRMMNWTPMTQVTPTAPARRRWLMPAPRTSAMSPWALVVFAIVSVQIGAAFAKQLFDVTGPSGVVFIRTLLTGILFAVLWRPDVRKLPRREIIWIVLYGVNVAVMMLSFYAAIERIPLGIAVAISFAGPLGIAVAGSRRRVDLLWAGMAAVGILLLSPFSNVDLDAVGILLSLVSAATWAGYVLIGRRVCTVLDGNSVLAMSLLIAALTVAPFGLAGALRVLTSPSLILLSLFVAFLSSAVPFYLEFEAIRRLPPRVFGLLLSLEPVAATIVGFVLLHEALGLREVGGILMVTVAAAATARSG